MFFAKVTGQVIATQKTGNLESTRLLSVRMLDENLRDKGQDAVCVDSVGAKPGDVVLTCTSSSARLTRAAQGTCSDHTIVGIVDTVSASHKDRYTGA